ncbi:hypothetical protein QQY24_18270 [Streptomyces sp. TG1A-8]|uniref:hypothetical protein n=1 Tax=Streptomyces sp. TG1A-8 TaxID=3051385 RepID=UPI00265C7990|nr:hypothetical protein [Streptomyces sp. TG1A-8]MDO0927263.1 hypothetical protein [Streptomyces sp. TG1A-8]
MPAAPPGGPALPAAPRLPGPARPPRPPGTDAPATRGVPPFAPVRVRGGRYRARRFVRQRRRALAAGLAVTAAALVAAGPRAAPRADHAERPRGRPAAGPVPGRDAGERDTGEAVTAPVRIADAATVRLLRPGDRVDVIAAGDPADGGGARVLARGVRVTGVPEPLEGAAESGALVVLSVPRATAAALVGASATARLAVTLC